MGNICGTVIQQSPSTYSWLFDFEKLPNACSSEKFYICGNKYEVSFRLENFFRNKSYLFLHVFKTFALKMDLHLIMRYKYGTTDYSLEDIVCHSIGQCRLVNVETCGLIEVRCTFSNIRESTISGWIKVKEEHHDPLERSFRSFNHENDKIEVAEIQPVKSKGEERNSYNQDKGNQKIKYDYEKINCELSEPIKSKGLAESLKDAFLSEEDSDVIFKVGDQTYPAHKVIIKCRSSVFRAMLKHDMREKNQGTINIPDCDPCIFTDFLFYLYTGILDSISKENVFELHRMSDKYDVKDLSKACVEFMIQNLCVDIICDVISLATRHSERSLLFCATQFFIEHAEDILTTVDWQTFVKEHPVEANELFLKTFKKGAGK